MIVFDNCTGCGACVAVCPFSALSLETEHANGFGRKKAVVETSLCCSCGACVPRCPHRALGLCMNIA